MSAFKFDRTNRGFKTIEFNDTYNQHCTIQESSSAEEARLWVGVPGEPYNRMHINQEMAGHMAAILLYFNRTGGLPESDEDY